jgi:hypothetical protein
MRDSLQGRQDLHKKELTAIRKQAGPWKCIRMKHWGGGGGRSYNGRRDARTRSG